MELRRGNRFPTMECADKYESRREGVLFDRTRIPSNQWHSSGIASLLGITEPRRNNGSVWRTKSADKAVREEETATMMMTTKTTKTTTTTTTVGKVSQFQGEWREARVLFQSCLWSVLGLLSRFSRRHGRPPFHSQSRTDDSPENFAINRILVPPLPSLSSPLPPSPYRLSITTREWDECKDTVHNVYHHYRGAASC